jgi:hypothetical protein
MKSEKQRILEAYSADLKAMFTEGEESKNPQDVQKWVVDTPTHVKEKHNIVDAYASIVEADEYRHNKIAHLNEEILKEGAKKKYKAEMDKHKADMDHYEECDDMEKYEESKHKYEQAKKDYEELDESEGLKPAPSPSKHQATNTEDGGDTTNGKVSKEVMDQQYDKHMKEGDDEDDEDGDDMHEADDEHDDEDMHEADYEDDMDDEDEVEVKPPQEVVHGTGSKDGGVVTKQDLSYKHMKENKQAYMKYAKSIIGDRDLSKMSDEEKKELFNKIDAGWNSEDEAGEDGKK